jgi:hypothetical protein
MSNALVKHRNNDMRKCAHQHIKLQNINMTSVLLLLLIACTLRVASRTAARLVSKSVSSCDRVVWMWVMASLTAEVWAQTAPASPIKSSKLDLHTSAATCDAEARNQITHDVTIIYNFGFGIMLQFGTICMLLCKAYREGDTRMARVFRGNTNNTNRVTALCIM